MTDAQYRVLAARFMQERLTAREPTGYRSFLKWIEANGFKKPSERKARSVLKAITPRGIRTNSWEGLTKDGPVTLEQTRIDWDFETTRLKEDIEEFIASKVRPLPVSASPSGSLVGVLSIPDIHVGKLAWGAEVGENYDTSIAVETYTLAASHLLKRLSECGVAHILYVVGNDLLHVDGFDNTTTAGTPQDVDSRFQKAFKRAKEMVVSTIVEAANIAEVDVIIQPGNHDRLLTWTLGEVIAALFNNSQGINIVNKETYRKYVQYGRLLFGITHGDKTKHTALPTIMATEAPEAWGETRHREWLLGHRHRKQDFMSIGVDEHNGVRIRYLPSLSGQDRWHYEHGYSNLRSAETHVYSPEEGVQVASYYYHFTG